jgi:TonB family protein
MPGTADKVSNENEIIIDYTDLQPGDEAPDAPPRPSAARPGSANVVVLSADPILIDLLRDSVAGTHRVWRADDARHAADLLVAAGNPALLLDSALGDVNAKELVTKLHQQFPDLPIIVAGTRDDEGQLSPLVSEGAIFRFLHMPASAERIRNFVDATQRRPQHDLRSRVTPRQAAALASAQSAHTAEHPKLTLPKFKVNPVVVRRWLRRSLLLMPILIAAWAVTEWKPWERITLMLPNRSAPIAPTDAGRDPALLGMLDSAGLALSQGRLIDPPEQNALELYRAVLSLDPGNRMAQRGIDSVADELLVEAERALMELDLPRLASAIDAARSARPDHQRLEFFVAHLERERAMQSNNGQIQRSTAANAAAVGRELDASAAETPAGRARGLLLLANGRMRSKRLYGGRDSAHAYLMSARRLDPANPGVQQGILALAGLILANAERTIRENRLDEAGNWLQAVIALDVNHKEVASLRADLEAARLGNVRSDRTRILLLANQRIAQNQLIEPRGDSARHYVDLLHASDPDFEGLADTRVLFSSRALDESRKQIVAGNLDRADVLLRAASSTGAPASEVSALSAQIMAGRIARPAAAPPPAAVLPENAMRRTRFIAPQYPVRARERGTEGWVDIEFTVNTDGTTRDASVKAAEPAGVFDRAALDAVGRWRYEPRVVNGSVIDQRVEARLRFQLED